MKTYNYSHNDIDWKLTIKHYGKDSNWWEYKIYKNGKLVWDDIVFRKDHPPSLSRIFKEMTNEIRILFIGFNNENT